MKEHSEKETDRIYKIKQKIIDINDKIDEIVYGLYELENDEITIIKENS